MSISDPEKLAVVSCDSFFLTGNVTNHLKYDEISGIQPVTVRVALGWHVGASVFLCPNVPHRGRVPVCACVITAVYGPTKNYTVMVSLSIVIRGSTWFYPH